MSSLPPPPPPPAAPLPQPAMPPGAPQPPPARSGMSGCAIAALVVGAIVVIGVVGVVVLGAVVFKKAKDTVERNVLPHDCPVLSNRKAKDLFGRNAEATTEPFGGLVGSVLDDRVLAGAQSCWVTNADGNRTILIRHSEGGDAEQRYRQEHDLAQPQSQDQGNGMTLERDGYFDKDVSGLGDDAFCTSLTMAGASGVLVRQGDRLVYVSIEMSPDEMDPSKFRTNGDQGLLIDDQLCEDAQKAARAIVG